MFDSISDFNWRVDSVRYQISFLDLQWIRLDLLKIEIEEFWISTYCRLSSYSLCLDFFGLKFEIQFSFRDIRVAKNFLFFRSKFEIRIEMYKTSVRWKRYQTKWFHLSRLVTRTKESTIRKSIKVVENFFNAQWKW